MFDFGRYGERKEQNKQYENRNLKYDFSTPDVHQKDRKEEKIKTVDVTFC